MRLFLAISLPQSLRNSLSGLSKSLPKYGQMKLVKEENIHITLKFLGESEPEAVINALESVKFRPFEVFVNGIGAFPTASRARVIWAGCDKGSKEIIDLHKEIEKALPQFEKDKDFHPHATLSRVNYINDKQGLLEAIRAHNGKEFGSFEATSFELMKSELSRNGPEYGAVKSFSLD
jgi:RNA 2',3'-cyclic 3'-phosphodiesterase